MHFLKFLKQNCFDNGGHYIDRIYVKFYRFLDRTLLTVIFPECYDKAYKLAKDQVDRFYYLQDITEDEIVAKYFSK